VKYETPKIVELGSIADLTRNSGKGGGGGKDGGGGKQGGGDDGGGGTPGGIS
jgi:hypothetical protein